MCSTILRNPSWSLRFQPTNQPTNPTPSNHDGKHLPHSVARTESHQGVIDVVQAAAYLGQAVVFLYKVRGPSKRNTKNPTHRGRAKEMQKTDRFCHKVFYSMWNLFFVIICFCENKPTSNQPKKQQINGFWDGCFFWPFVLESAIFHTLKKNMLKSQA